MFAGGRPAEALAVLGRDGCNASLSATARLAQQLILSHHRDVVYDLSPLQCSDSRSYTATRKNPEWHALVF